MVRRKGNGRRIGNSRRNQTSGRGHYAPALAIVSAARRQYRSGVARKSGYKGPSDPLINRAVLVLRR